MKALFWNGKPYPEGFELREVERPKADSDWIVVQNKAAGICGSDHHIVAGKIPLPKDWLPAILGHENAGIVVEVGKNVTEVEKGDRVAVEPLHGCYARGIYPPCKFCQIGHYHLCPNLVHVGTYYPGGFGEYSPVHKSKVFKIPDSLSFEEAAILDCLAVGVHAVKIGKPLIEDSVAVMGCGTIGLDVVQCLKAEGAPHVIGVAKYRWQAEAAKKVGADDTICLDEVDVVDAVMELTGGRGVDQAYDCVGGATEAFQQCITMCRPGAKIVLVGVYDGVRPVNLQLILLKEIQVLPSFSYAFFNYKPEFEIALQLLLNNFATHKPLITHRFKLDEWKKAWEVSSKKREFKSIKTVFTY